MEWIKVIEPPKEDCEVPVKVYNYELETELYRIGIFQRGKWVIRDQYKREDVIAWLDESAPSTTKPFTLKDMHEFAIFTAERMVNEIKNPTGIKSLEANNKYFKEKFGIDI